MDSHIHFWDPGHLDYPWLRAHRDLHRPFLPADVDLGTVEVEAFLFVQANPVWDQADEENRWVAALAEDDPRIAAIVAGAPLDRGPTLVAAELARLGRTPGIVGVRQLIQDEPAGFAVAADFVDSVRLAGDSGLAVDLCVRHHQLREVTRLAAACPEVSFVLDHLGKPDIAGGGIDAWVPDLRRLADLPNVSCKLSGLMTEADEATSDRATIGRYLRAAVDAFGPARCMFGSDWPNASMRISYEGWVEMVRTAIDDLPPEDQDQIMRRTAQRVYSLAWALAQASSLHAEPTGGSAADVSHQQS